MRGGAGVAERGAGVRQDRVDVTITKGRKRATGFRESASAVTLEGARARGRTGIRRLVRTFRSLRRVGRSLPHTRESRWSS